jgi:hypothetical protein
LRRNPRITLRVSIRPSFANNFFSEIDVMSYVRAREETMDSVENGSREPKFFVVPCGSLDVVIDKDFDDYQ